MEKLKKFGSALNVKIFKPLWRSIQDDEIQFRIWTATKITIIPLFSVLVMFFLMVLFLRLNLGFFAMYESVEFSFLRELFFEYVFKNALDRVPLFLSLFVLQFLIGLYIARLLLRPFVAIGNYCKQAFEQKEVSYDPDFFTDLKLLTRFAEYFFNWLENVAKTQRLEPVKIPRKFTQIHKPVFESQFFIQYSFFIFSSSLTFAIISYSVVVGIQENIISFASETLSLNREINNFLLKQSLLLEDILLGVVIFHFILNLILAVHLYSRVSGPAFGMFATMRSFIKGNYKARVHLIGYYYVRKQCRFFNKYLDFIERKCVK